MPITPRAAKAKKQTKEATTTMASGSSAQQPAAKALKRTVEAAKAATMASGSSAQPPAAKALERTEAAKAVEAESLKTAIENRVRIIAMIKKMEGETIDDDDPRLALVKALYEKLDSATTTPGTSSKPPAAMATDSKPPAAMAPLSRKAWLKTPCTPRAKKPAEDERGTHVSTASCSGSAQPPAAKPLGRTVEEEALKHKPEAPNALEQQAEAPKEDKKDSWTRNVQRREKKQAKAEKGTKVEKRKVEETRMATAKAERTIVSTAAATQRRLNDLNYQLMCAQSKQATRITALEEASKAADAAKEEYAKHESHENLNRKKSKIAARDTAADRHALWTRNIAHLQGMIAELSAKQ